MELQFVHNRIFLVRETRVMLDFHLAELYKVDTRSLKQAVKRNLRRFPPDFMYKLTKSEWRKVITNCDNLPANVKYSPATPFAFTEQGVAMLSSILKSTVAVDVNIAIMRAFAALRQHLVGYSDLKQQLKKLEKVMNRKFKDVNDVLNYLLSPQSKPAEIGFKQKGRTSHGDQKLITNCDKLPERKKRTAQKKGKSSPAIRSLSQFVISSQGKKTP